MDSARFEALVAWIGQNPLAAGLVVLLAGLALLAGSWLLAVASGAAAAAAHAWVVRVEEPRLRDRFGAAYVEYLRSVPRWLPHRSRRS